MAARTCSECGIAYPYLIEVCRVCESALAYTAHTYPDRNWEKEAAKLRNARDYSGLLATPPKLSVRPFRDRQSRYFLYETQLEAAGWKRPMDEIQYFELLDGAIYEVMGRDAPRGRYWIEPFLSDGGF
jgi:hypothetical protein